MKRNEKNRKKWKKNRCVYVWFRPAPNCVTGWVSDWVSVQLTGSVEKRTHSMYVLTSWMPECDNKLTNFNFESETTTAIKIGKESGENVHRSNHTVCMNIGHKRRTNIFDLKTGVLHTEANGWMKKARIVDINRMLTREEKKIHTPTSEIANH